MDGDAAASAPVGFFVIISFFLIALIVMGCMLYWNWTHRKQNSADVGDNITNGNACIYEKNNQRAYNRSSNWLKWLINRVIPFLIALHSFPLLISSIDTKISPPFVCTYYTHTARINRAIGKKEPSLLSD